MKILHITPSQDGFYMPAEFAPHEGCLMIWPERADSWQYGAYAARKAFLRVIETISESESMTVLCSEGQYDNARAQLPDRVRLVAMRGRVTLARPLLSTAGESAAASTGVLTRGAAMWTACIPRGRTTTAWPASSATCSAMTFTISVILSARAARSTPTARTTRSMRFPSRDRTLCWPPGRTDVQPRRLTAEQVHKDGQELGITLYGQYLPCL